MADEQTQQALETEPQPPSPTLSEEFGGDFIIYNRPPIKEVCLAFLLLALGALGIIVGSWMTYNKVWGDRSHGISFIILGILLFIPGFHESRIAYFASLGTKTSHSPIFQQSSPPHLCDALYIMNLPIC
ncbi:hypothetical protein CLOM_g14058 [Closterium sp. NIES-68]|nr:hypothetical protein CLOM_g14058 [Closterium sp. NIES-68]